MTIKSLKKKKTLFLFNLLKYFRSKQRKNKLCTGKEVI